MANSYLSPWRRGSLSSSGAFGANSLFDLHRQMNQLFDDLVDRGPAAATSAASSGGTGWPQLEIEQDEGRIRIVAELPGVDQDDIELTVEDGVLSLSGEKRSERKDENGYSERSYGRFERRIALPSNIDEEACSADFRNGVLTVTIPRAQEKARGRRIPLGQGTGPAGTIAAHNDASPAPRQEAAEEAGGSQRADAGQQG